MDLFLGYTISMITHTPLWVWGLLVLLIWLGALGLRRRRLTPRRAAVVPVVFIIWGLTGLAIWPFEAGVIAALWLGGLILGTALGLATGPRPFNIDRARREVELPASGWPLARNLIVFFAHYGVLVIAAIWTTQQAAWLQADIAVSGASAGYFIGWFIALLRQYRAAPADTQSG